MATAAAAQAKAQEPSGPSLPVAPPVPPIPLPGAAKEAVKGAAVATGGAVGVTAATLHALSNVLAKQRMINRRWLAAHAGPRPGTATLRQLEVERQRETTFARVSAGRITAGMPKAVALGTPEARRAAVEQLLDAERRYATMQATESMRRLQGAVNMDRVQAESPLGAMWLLGPAKEHTEGCLVMQRRFWPWAVLHRVHPPRHPGCTGHLIGLNDAIAHGLMTMDDIPTLYDAINDASGVMMEGDAERLLAELEVRERLLAGGADPGVLARISWLGEGYLAEAFDEAKHPRGWAGRFRRVGEVAAAITDTMLGWRGRMEQAGRIDPDPNAPSREQIVSNWTKQVRGRLSTDRAAIGHVAAAQAENRANGRYQALIAGLPEDHVIVMKEREGPSSATLLAGGSDAAERVAGTTVIGERSVHRSVAEAEPGSEVKPRAVTSGYGLAALLRHEYGHSIDEMLSQEQRRAIVGAIENVEKDLSYYAGWHLARGNIGEVIPELVATITQPGYRPENFPAGVGRAEQLLLEALGKGQLSEFDAAELRDPAGRWTRGGSAVKDALPDLPGVPFVPPAEHVDADGMYHLYHGTNEANAAGIRAEGLKAPSGTGPGWFLLTTSHPQARTYAEGVSVRSEPEVLHFAIPAKDAPRFLSAPVRHDVYGHEAFAHGLLPGRHLPARYLAAAVAEEFDPAEHPRGWHGRFRDVGHEFVSAAEAAAALKRHEPAAIRPEHAEQLIDALNDGERSSLHLLQVGEHPNLFRANARDLPRAEMPQIPKAALPGFMDFLREHRVMATIESVPPSRLRATQNQVNGAAAAAIARGWDPTRGGMLMVSHNWDVLDGHHRWAGGALYELLHADYEMQVLRFSADTDRMLALMREYNRVAGVEARAFGEGKIPVGAEG